MRFLKQTIRRVLKYLLSIALMLYSWTIGLFTGKGQYIHSLVCEYFGFAFPKPKLPLISPAQVLSSAPLRLAELEVQPGNMPVSELAALCGIVRRENPRAIFEIGTLNGRTTLNLALNSPPECRIFTLDLPREQLGETRYPISDRFRKLVEKERSGELFLNKDAAEFPETKKITQLFGDSGNFDFSPYYNAIDLVFIDGSHDYEYVLNDSEIALKLLREGRGVILWHDYRGGMEVITALETFRKRRPGLSLHHVRDTSFAYLKR